MRRLRFQLSEAAVSRIYSMSDLFPDLFDGVSLTGINYAEDLIVIAAAPPASTPSASTSSHGA